VKKYHFFGAIISKKNGLAATRKTHSEPNQRVWCNIPTLSTNFRFLSKLM